MIALLVNLIVLCLVFGILYWVITLLPIPAPFKNVALVVFALILVIVLLGLVGWIPGYQIHGWRY